MFKIPLIPAEEIGYHLGLIVPPEKAKFFYNVRTSSEKPPAGYGTRIYDPKYQPNKAFKKLGIPLTLTIKPIAQFNSAKKLLAYLKQIENADKDALLCFHHGTLVDDASRDWGHVVVFDRLIKGKIRIVDPDPQDPKWGLVTPQKMFEAMKKHGEKRSAGVWTLL
ncbi:MAG: hypothetical protein HYT09_04205 [Candidatus Levybacteria bacterium]|nr:hypothetical protein [Candidatus Levybacteria bacterium]